MSWDRDMLRQVLPIFYPYTTKMLGAPSITRYTSSNEQPRLMNGIHRALALSFVTVLHASAFYLLFQSKQNIPNRLALTPSTSSLTSLTTKPAHARHAQNVPIIFVQPLGAVSPAPQPIEAKTNTMNTTQQTPLIKHRLLQPTPQKYKKRRTLATQRPIPPITPSSAQPSSPSLQPDEKAPHIMVGATSSPSPTTAVMHATPISTPSLPPDDAANPLISHIEYLRKPHVVYPRISQKLGEQGRVLVRVRVGPNGYPEKVEIQTSSNIHRLDDAAKQAVMNAIFKPYMRDGQKKAHWAIIPIHFALISSKSHS